MTKFKPLDRNEETFQLGHSGLFSMAWTPRPLNSQVLAYVNRNSSSKLKAATTQVLLQKGSGRMVPISPTSPMLLLTSWSQLSPRPCQWQLPQLLPGQHVFHLATGSDLAITGCTHLPFLVQLLCCMMGKAFEPHNSPFCTRARCPSCWAFNWRWVSSYGSSKVFSQ